MSQSGGGYALKLLGGASGIAVDVVATLTGQALLTFPAAPKVIADILGGSQIDVGGTIITIPRDRVFEGVVWVAADLVTPTLGGAAAASPSIVLVSAAGSAPANNTILVGVQLAIGAVGGAVTLHTEGQLCVPHTIAAGPNGPALLVSQLLGVTHAFYGANGVLL